MDSLRCCFFHVPNGPCSRIDTSYRTVERWRLLRFFIPIFPHSGVWGAEAHASHSSHMRGLLYGVYLAENDMHEPQALHQSINCTVAPTLHSLLKYKITQSSRLGFKLHHLQIANLS
eukprot:6478349-Amphidinium_carterae.1